MTRATEIRLVLLFEDELRLAAAALKHVQERGEEGATLEDYGRIVEACWVALYHLALPENTLAHIMVAPKRFGRRR